LLRTLNAAFASGRWPSSTLFQLLSSPAIVSVGGFSDVSDSDANMTDALQLPHAPPPFAYEDASVSTLDWETLQSEACTVQHTAAGGDGYDSNATAEWDVGPSLAACAVAASAALSAALHAKRCAADVLHAPLTAWTYKAPRQSSTSAPLSPSVSGSVPFVLGNRHAIVAPGIASTAPSVPVALLQGLNSHSVSVSPAAASIAPSVSDAVVLEPVVRKLLFAQAQTQQGHLQLPGWIQDMH
jgi:hypothetical protein